VSSSSTEVAVADGSFHGLRTGVVESAHVRLEFTLDAGPRIVRLSATDGENLFAETPGIGWDTVHGRPYRLLGGHRLWSAPECPLEQQVPDDEPVEVTRHPGGFELTGSTRTHDGLSRRIVVELDPAGPRVRVMHRLVNSTSHSVRAAVWALTQLAPGGVAVVPLRGGQPEGSQLPDRHLVLWPYASVADARLHLSDDAVRVRAAPAPEPFKIGCFAPGGEVAYERAGTVFRKRFAPQAGREHVDRGCNVEVYARTEFLELETLGPIAEIAPDEVLDHVEEWEIATG
jgi:hypothetical protein